MTNDIGLILLITAIVSTIATFFGPAEIAMIPVVVPRKQLLPANSLHIFTLQAAFFIGFALLGPLVVNLDQSDRPVRRRRRQLRRRRSAVSVPAERRPTRPHGVARLAAPRRCGARVGEGATAVRTTFDQLADGVRYIFANRSVFWPLTYLAVTASLIGVLGVLGPGFATQVLGLSERDFVVVVLPLGLGLVMGILVLNVYGKHFTRRRGIEGGLIGLGLTLIALSHRPAAHDAPLSSGRRSRCCRSSSSLPSRRASPTRSWQCRRRRSSRRSCRRTSAAASSASSTCS